MQRCSKNSVWDISHSPSPNSPLLAGDSKGLPKQCLKPERSGDISFPEQPWLTMVLPIFSWTSASHATVISTERILQKCCGENINSPPSIRKEEQTTLQITSMVKVANPEQIFRLGNVKNKTSTKET